MTVPDIGLGSEVAWPAFLEESALRVYALAHADPLSAPGSGFLAKRLFGYAGIIYVQGIPAGDVQVRFLRPSSGGAPFPAAVEVAEDQTDEQLALSLARGCAIYGAWFRTLPAAYRRIDPAVDKAVAEAILLPRDLLRVVCDDGWSSAEIADAFVCEIELVRHRLRAVGLVCESGEYGSLRG